MSYREAVAEDVISVQSAVLCEIAEELRDEGLDEEARRIDHVVQQLDERRLAYDRVRDVAPLLDQIHHRLQETSSLREGSAIAGAVLEVRRRIVKAVDRLLHDTQPIDPSEIKKPS